MRDCRIQIRAEHTNSSNGVNDVGRKKFGHANVCEPVTKPDLPITNPLIRSTVDRGMGRKVQISTDK